MASVESHSEHVAAVPNYVEDAEFEVKDGNFFITYLREINGEMLVVDRVIIPMTRVPAMRMKAAMALIEGKRPLENVLVLIH